MKRVTVSLPDDVAGFLETTPNTSAAVVNAVRLLMANAEQRASARRAGMDAYRAILRNTPGLVDDLAAAIAVSNEITASEAGIQW